MPQPLHVLRFGTDGVRGVANSELTPEFALSLGRAAARVLGGSAFVVGRDTRRSGPLLSAAFAFGLFVAGRFSADLRNFNQVVKSRAAAALAQGLYWVLPNLAPFDVRSQVVHAQPVPAVYLALTTAYGVIYIAALLAAATFIFSRRDFK